MPSIINADDGQISGSAGLKIVSASDGILKIQNNGVDAVNVDSSNIVTFAAPSRSPVTSIPFLIAVSSSTASPAYNAWTERTVGYTAPTPGEGIGSGSFSGGRYTPDVPGLYQISVNAQTQATTQSLWGAAVFLNGVNYRYAYWRLNTGSTTNGNVSTSAIAKLNGTTDFVSGGYYIGASTGVTTLIVWLSVCLLQRIE